MKMITGKPWANLQSKNGISLKDEDNVYIKRKKLSDYLIQKDTNTHNISEVVLSVSNNDQ
jgi:hypothetical protein